MDLQKIREKLTQYRNRIGISQADLADAAHVHKGVLSDALNGKRAISTDLIHRIILYLAEEEAIRGKSQVVELLELTESEDFSKADWKSPPLVDLAPEPPSTLIPSHQIIELETPLVAAFNEPSASTQNSEDKDDDDVSQTSTSSLKEEQKAVDAETPETRESNLAQGEGNVQITLFQSSNLQNSHLSPKDRLEVAYRQLIDIVETRFQFASVVEALRKFNGEVAYETLPRVKKELDAAEVVFHEQEVARTLRLLDNNKAWSHYVMGTVSFNKYRERTKDLVEKALEPRSPLVYIIPNIDALLAGDRWRDDDPKTRQIYQEMEKEFNAMLRAMNKRLKL